MIFFQQIKSHIIHVSFCCSYCSTFRSNYVHLFSYPLILLKQYFHIFRPMKENDFISIPLCGLPFVWPFISACLCIIFVANCICGFMCENNKVNNSWCDRGIQNLRRPSSDNILILILLTKLYSEFNPRY